MMHNLLSTIKTHKWKSLSLVLFMTILIVVPIAVQYGLQQALLKQGQAQGIDRVEIGDIDFNPFLVNLSLENLKLYRQNQLYAQVDYAEVQISLLALLRQKLLVETLYLSHSQLPIKLVDQQLIIAGLSLPESTEQTPEESASQFSFGFGIEEVKFEAISLSFELIENQQSKGKTQYDISLLTIDEEADFHRLILNSQLNQSDLAANLQLHPFDESPKVVGTLDLDRFQLEQLTYLAEYFAPESSSYLNGILSHNLTFTLKQTEQGLTYHQQGLIQLKQYALKQANLKADFNQFNWKGDFHFIQNNPDGDGQLLHLKGLTSVKRLNIDETELQIQASQDINAQLNLDVQLTPELIRLQQTGHLSVKQLKAVQAPFLTELEAIKWQGSINATLPLKEESTTPLQLVVSGLIDLQGLTSTDEKPNLQLLELGSFNIAQFTLKQTGQQLNHLIIENLGLKQLNLLDTRRENSPPLLTLQKLNLNQAKLETIDSKTPNLLTLGTFDLTNSQTNLVLNADGQVTVIDQQLASLQKQNLPTKNAAVKADKKSKTKTAPFHFSVGGLTLSGKHKILVRAVSKKLPIDKTFQITKLNVGAVNSQKQKQKTPYEIKILFDEFSKINSQGEFQAFNKRLNVLAKTEVESLSLLELSPFAEQFIGYQVQSGQVSANLNTKIINNKLDAKNDLNINQLEISSRDNQGEAFKKQLNMPLEAGISLLKDRKDNIHLTLPVKGDLSDLNFELNDVITTALNNALLKATKTYLLLALQPFGAILMAGEFAADQMTAVKLQAITFDAGSEALAPEMQTYLKKINKLLNERKGIQIKLCGGTKEVDRMALHQQATEAANLAIEKAKKEGSKPPEAAEIVINNEQLFALAQSRKNSIKRQLVELGSSANQIILCQPTLQTSEGKPSVEVGI